MEKLGEQLKQKRSVQEQIIMIMQQKIAAISQEQARAGISGLKL
jgi:hypothetical protein